MDKNSKRKLVLSIDSASDEAREMVPLKQVFVAPKKITKKKKQPMNDEKPKNKKIYLIKHVS